ncbi:PRC-barrel domain-containing protein [Devosia sp.]|uniref:PRC-barrel domain-containing protein n=1 Tax=Devosia sp. TaxID=1871048 RepID=UPI002F0EB886
MIRTLLTTTALAALLATGAMAQDAAAPAAQPAASGDMLAHGYQMVDTDGLASRLLGFPVYASAAAEAERIGEINDLVINEAGDVAAVIIGVGGFLGVGEKNVAVDYAQLEWTTAADNTERLVLGTTKEALAAAPAVELVDDKAAGRTAQAPAPVQPGADADMDETRTGSVNTQPGAAATAPTTFDRSSLNALDEATLTAEELIGTDVYGPNDEHVGTIGDFVLAADGKTIDAIIVDVGGFLGIGAKEVAIGFENLDFAADANNNRYLLLNVTKAQLEEQAAFNRDTYANERETQRLMVQAS